MAKLLGVENITRKFGGLEALCEVSFDVQAGEIVGVIGPNGAGKTTLFNVITGVYPPTSGRIVLEENVLSKLKPHKVAQNGIIRTFQADVLFRELTVLQNVLVGLHMKSMGLRPRQMLFSSTLIPPAETDRASDILETVGLAELREVLAGDLPHGHQRLLGIAVSLAAEPKVLLMDEPVTGMNLNEIKAVTDLVGRLNEEKGMTILLVEHNIKTVMAICQRVVVLNFGKKIAEGPPEEIRRNKDVIEAYLGPESA